MPDNREFASLFWIAVALLVFLFKKDVRNCLGELLRTVLGVKVLLPLLAMFGYVALEALLGFKLGIWRSDLLKATLLWIASTGFAMLFGIAKVSSEPHFFRRSVLAAVGITAFLEFLVNTAPMNLIAEILLQPIIAVAAILSVLATYQGQYRSFKKSTDTFLALIGLTLLAYTIHWLYSNWGGLDKTSLLLELGLPVWLTVALLPFIYVFSLFANYQLAFERIDCAAKDGKTHWQAKLAVLAKLHVRMQDAHRFAWPWTEKIVSVDSFSAARQVVADFLKSKREASRGSHYF